jgi:hypothetical protein
MNHRDQGYGQGPRRGVFTAAAKHLLATQTQMGLWQEQNGWLVPKLSPLQDEEQSPERLLEFRLAGTFFALYMMIMHHPVTKISPHVLLLLLSGSCPPNSRYLRAVDPNSASILAPWFAFMEHNEDSATVIDEPTKTQVRHLLADYLGESVRRSLFAYRCTVTHSSM